MSFLSDLKTTLVASSQPHHTKDIDDADPQAIEQTVLGNTALARPVSDGHRLHPTTRSQKQRGQEAMHMIEAW
jgi:hypothetical protein